ncbi:MAG: hypothetical protein KKB50_19925 [Planctomycetes bacterium]|nr:hypothetical protein [Planctomycetota bacterium]
MFASLAFALGAMTVGACSMRPATRTVSVRALRQAPVVTPSDYRHAILSDTTAIDDLHWPLGERLGLLQVRNQAEWRRLTAVAPELGSPPDFERGMVIGLLSRAGVPLNDCWPIDLDVVRVHGGAGLVSGRFCPGTYFPDGTAYLETAYVEGLVTVLIVDINGVRFYPE